MPSQRAQNALKGHKVPSKGILCPQLPFIIVVSNFLVSQCSWVIVGTFIFMIHYLSLVAPLSVIQVVCLVILFTLFSFQFELQPLIQSPYHLPWFYLGSVHKCEITSPPKKKKSLINFTFSPFFYFNQAINNCAVCKYVAVMYPKLA